jgi:hypothetical protein
MTNTLGQIFFKGLNAQTSGKGMELEVSEHQIKVGINRCKAFRDKSKTFKCSRNIPHNCVRKM